MEHVFSAALKKQDVVPNLDGTGFVVLVSQQADVQKELGNLMELISAFGAERLWYLGISKSAKPGGNFSMLIPGKPSMLIIEHSDFMVVGLCLDHHTGPVRIHGIG